MKLRDYIDLNFDASKLHHTKEGYLTGKLCVTGAGVFFYRDSKGEGIIGRLRPRDQVEASVLCFDLANCKHRPYFTFGYRERMDF